MSQVILARGARILLNGHPDIAYRFVRDQHRRNH